MLLAKLLDPLLDPASVLLERAGGLCFFGLHMPCVRLVCPIDANEGGCLSYTGVHGFLLG